jgi:hypothetical protein
MLDKVDRMQLVIRDASLASATFENLLGAVPAREEISTHLDAKRLIMSLGSSELELCEPIGDGRARHQLDNFGEGLMTAGFSTQDVQRLADHLASMDVPFTQEQDQLYLGADVTYGLPMVVSPSQTRERVGPVSFFYEATNTLQTDWKTVADRYCAMFGLDANKFSRISNTRFGYDGTLTLFNPDAGLDRIELSQTFADQPGAMRRFVEKRGDSFYMCFVETHDFVALRDRLLSHDAGMTARSLDIANERDTLWVHPKSLHGMLLGVSRTGFGWTWSGKPDQVPALDERSGSAD